MAKCTVIDADGQRFEVEAHTYDLLEVSGFVVLKRRVAPADPTNHATSTAAIFHRPRTIIMGTEEVTTSGAI